MSKKEIERVKILTLLREGHFNQIIAGQMLGITDRQVRNLLKKHRREGDKGLISKKRGKASNHRKSQDFKEKVINIVQQNYPDFGPKLATEYLQSKHNINISVETLRQWMIQYHLWIPKNEERKKLHLPRERRRAFGELIQIDGSHHHWFEDRSPPCVLMVFVDDATSSITSLHFAESESIDAYYRTLEKHLKKYGRPIGFYGDRCSSLTPRNPKNSNDQTQFKRTLNELGCELILALSPQAKGKVERANRTLQDRLVKELRLRNISSISEGNAMLDEFREQYNTLFSKKPSELIDAHRSLEGVSLNQVLCTRETRTLNKDFVVQLHNLFFYISSQGGKTKLYKGAKIEVRKCLDGKRIALFKGEQLKMTPLSEVSSEVLDAKQVQVWKPKEKYIPPKSHPFKHEFVKIKYKDEILEKVV
jgi:hypothetical protein